MGRRAITTNKWLGGLLLSSLLLLAGLSASAQTNWTTRHQNQLNDLYDVTYGAGTYVAVGVNGLIRLSQDGLTWTNQVAGTTSANDLSAVIYAAGKFVATGNNGRVLTSLDGLTWTAQVSGTTTLLNGITFGGGKFVVVGLNSTIITSTDGITWTTQVSGPPGPALFFNDVAYAGGQFVVVGDYGTIKTSPDGVNWTARAIDASLGLRSVTVGNGGLFVATGFNSTIITSPDGVIWTKRSVPGSNKPLSSVACNAATGQFVAVSNLSNEVVTSPDGLTWSLNYSGTQRGLFEVQYINSQFITVGEFGCIRSSTDGKAWKPLTIDVDIEFEGVAYGNGHYVAVGTYPVSLHPAIGTVAVTSTDGIHYTLGTTEHFSGASEGFNDVVFANGQFVAAGGLGIIQTSVDGKQWTIRYTNPSNEFYGIAYGGGQYVTVGSGFGGIFARSTDGITWTTGSTGQEIGPDLSGITYAQGQFVAVGYNGTIGTSPDGSVWTTRTSGTNKFLKSVVYGNGTYVAVGLGGIALKSGDGITWTAIPSFTGSDINHVTFGNGQFVSVGEDGEVFTSLDGTTWTERQTGTDGFKLNSIVHGNGLFVAVGAGATIATSPDDGVPGGNTAPTVANAIPAQVGKVNQPFNLVIPATTFTDAETPNNLTYSVTGLPSELAFTAPATISGTPTNVTPLPYIITVTATDPGGLSVNTNFALTVQVDQPIGNQPLQLLQPLYNCQTGALTFQTSGGDGSPVKYRAIGVTDWTTNPNQVLDAPVRQDLNSQPIPIQARQGQTMVSYSFDFRGYCTNVNPVSNQAPVFHGPLANVNGSLGSGFDYFLPPNTFTDPDAGDVLTYTATNLPPGLVLATGDIVGLPTTAGTYVVTLTATDTGGLTATGTITIVIENGSQPPVGNQPLTLITPLYDCQTGALTFQTSGGDGTPISFFCVGVVGGSTQTSYVLEAAIRNDANSQPLTIQATQSGVTVSYVFAWRLYCIQARIGAAEVAEAWTLRSLGNPVTNEVVVELTEATGQSVTLSLINLTGRVVERRTVTPSTGAHREVFDVTSQGAGVLLLRAESASRNQTLKLLK